MYGGLYRSSIARAARSGVHVVLSTTRNPDTVQSFCRQLKIETQNTNVRACRFYAAMGCTLASIDRHAYAAHPAIAQEARMLWRLEL